MDRCRYPELVTDLDKLRHNIEKVKRMCDHDGVMVAGVINTDSFHDDKDTNDQ